MTTNAISTGSGSDLVFRHGRKWSYQIATALCTVLFCLSQTSAQQRDALPWLYWPNDIETAASLKQAGIERIAVPPISVAAWRYAGFDATPLDESELAQREKLLTPRLAGRANVASATRRPWVDANGWRFTRNPNGKYFYDLTGALAGKAALAAAEAFAYRADAVIKLDASELPAFGAMLAFLRGLPMDELRNVADIGLIDDGSPLVGEVMNLFTRRNLLFQPTTKPLKQARLNIRLGSKAYPKNAAADPSAFALQVRRELGDENRSLRVYGAEVVICRLTSDGKTARLHLLNYSGREIESLRVRVRGFYADSQVRAYGFSDQALAELTAADGFTEFTVPKLGVYGVMDLLK